LADTSDLALHSVSSMRCCKKVVACLQFPRQSQRYRSANSLPPFGANTSSNWPATNALERKP
jgi:hypothetical protein